MPELVNLPDVNRTLEKIDVEYWNQLATRRVNDEDTPDQILKAVFKRVYNDVRNAETWKTVLDNRILSDKWSCVEDPTLRSLVMECALRKDFSELFSKEGQWTDSPFIVPWLIT